MEKRNVEKTKAIGDFIMACDELENSYSRGGKQKLQKVVGKKLFYQSPNGKKWFYNIPELKKKTTAQIKALNKKIRDNLKK